jgi:hypothetical protein
MNAVSVSPFSHFCVLIFFSLYLCFNTSHAPSEIQSWSKNSPPKLTSKHHFGLHKHLISSLCEMLTDCLAAERRIFVFACISYYRHACTQHISVHAPKVATPG